jgi:ubiquinone/menaquinone biosynthesis C-methylase UbiE
MQSVNKKSVDKDQKFPHKGRAGYLARKKLAEENALVAPAKKDTGWGKVAEWYHETVEDRASYQRDLIMPNLVRLMDVKRGNKVLDLGCGEGIFTRRFAKSGAEVTAIDIAAPLVEIAKRAAAAENEFYAFAPRFYVSDAAKIPMVLDATQDMVVINLALQNIENAAAVFKECARVLKTGGRLFIVLNHPAFRIPKASDWAWSDDGKTQYRRVWRYMSESREKIAMTPSAKTSEQTISFHRPLQFYIKLMGKAGLSLVNMEEWVSPKKSQPGPRAEVENRARNEIPLFMTLEIKKN